MASANSGNAHRVFVLARTELDAELTAVVFGGGNQTFSSQDANLSQLIFSKEPEFQITETGSEAPTFVEYAIDQILYSLRYIVLHLESNGGESEGQAVHLRPVQLVLERLFVRHWNSRRDFERAAGQTPQKFSNLIMGLLNEYDKSWVSKRVVNQFLVGLNQHSCDQIAKLSFMCQRPPSAANMLLSPVDTFISHPRWGKSIRSISKLRVRQAKFWANWANYVMQSNKSTEVWNGFVQEYSKLCPLNSASSSTLVPATYCLIALSRECLASSTPPPVENIMIFTEVLSLIEHPDIDVRCCGAVAATVLRQLLEVARPSRPKTETPPFGFESLANQPLFKAFHSFLNSGEDSSDNVTHQTPNAPEEEGEHSAERCQAQLSTATPIYKGMDASFIGRLKSWDLSTYNEILEIYTEPPKTLSDQEVLLIRHKALLRISVLISLQYQIDPKLASRFSKILLETDFHDVNVNLPLNLALYNLASSYPEPVCSTFGGMCFNSAHYSLGQRFKYLEYYGKLTNLLSGKQCIECALSPDDQAGLEEVDSCFWEYLAKERSTFRRCFQCRKFVISTPHSAIDSTAITSSSDKSASTSSAVGKTRRFASPRAKLEDLVIDPFSNQFCQHLWSPIYAGLIAFPDTNKMQMSGLVISYLGSAFQLLRDMIQGTSSSSIFVTQIAPQVTDLVLRYMDYDFTEVKLTAIRFLAFYLHHTNGATVQELRSSVDVFEFLESQSAKETDLEVRDCIQKIGLYVSATENAGFMRLVSGILG